MFPSSPKFKKKKRCRAHEFQAVADTVRTTLGPRGMDKLVYDGKRVTISNDGATIMRLLDVVHPAAKTLVDISMSQVQAKRTERRHRCTFAFARLRDCVLSLMCMVTSCPVELCVACSLCHWRIAENEKVREK